jgi:hypothetical protein
MNVCLTILGQFEALAPRSLSLRGRMYRWDPRSPDPAMTVLVDGEKSEIRVSYLAEKRSTEFVRSKVAVFVRYVYGLDLYAVRAVAYDGETLEDEDLFEIANVYAEDLANVSEWISRCEDDSEEGAA